MHWLHNNKEMKSHDDFSDDVVGFIYRISYTNNKVYIGKKLIRSLVRVKPTKAQLAIRKNYKRMEWKNKPFAKYNGSSKESVGLTIAKKEIIELCSDKINLTYAEMKHQVMCSVLTDDTYINANIAGKFFRGKIKSEVIDKGL